MPFKKLPRFGLRKARIGSGAKPKKKGLGRKIAGHVFKHKGKYAAGSAGFYLGSRRRKKEKEGY